MCWSSRKDRPQIRSGIGAADLPIPAKLKREGPARSRPFPMKGVTELPLRDDRRRRWTLTFAHLGVGGHTQESKHRSRC
jgi:hypothetical protein